jgi:parvulin-like peptidyl-prolyl isomerase
MSKIVRLLLIVATVLPHVAHGAVLLDRIVAVVNDEIVTQSDLAQFSKQEFGGTSGNADRLTQLMDQRLLLQEARRRGIAVGDTELDRALDDIQTRNNFPDREALETAFSREGTTAWGVYLQTLREQLTLLKLMRLILEVPPVQEAEARAYYDAHRSAFTPSAAIHLKQMLFPIPSDATDAAVRHIHETAQKALTEVLAGSDFDQTIQKYGEAQEGSAQSDLGVFKQGDLAPEIDAVIFGLKTGEVSPLVRSDLGFHIFKVTQQTEAAPKSFEESRSKIEEALLTQKQQFAHQKWLSELRKEAFLEIKPSSETIPSASPSIPSP